MKVSTSSNLSWENFKEDLNLPNLFTTSVRILVGGCTIFAQHHSDKTCTHNFCNKELGARRVLPVGDYATLY